MRDDFAGLAEVRRAVPFAHINTGEYLSLSGKHQLIEAGGADMLNIHGHFTEGLRAGWIAGEYGIPVTLGNTMFEVGVHLACALPECNWLENSFHNYNHLLKTPVEFKAGYAIAPDRPGHGLELLDEARAHYARPEVTDPDVLANETPPPSPITLS